MIAIRIKPLSSNQCWQGRRFKAKCYKGYEKELLLMLPAIEVPEGRLELSINVAFSNKASDLDNVVKPFLDILQKRYGFNDNRVYRIILNKLICKKGAEFIAFELKQIEG